jgi:hypothetical protein
MDRSQKLMKCAGHQLISTPGQVGEVSLKNKGKRTH